MTFNLLQSVSDGPTPEEVARYLGGNKARRAGRNWLTLCPAHNDRTPSLSVGSGDHRLLVHCLAGCSQAAVLDALKAQGVLTRSPSPRRQLQPVSHPKDSPTDPERVALAMSLWSRATPINGTLAERYLRDHRKLDVRCLGDLAHCLRWHAGKQAMLGLMTKPGSGESAGIHRTFLGTDGCKIERKMLGPQGVVRLSHDDDVATSLGITEGIEDAIAVLLSGWTPVWAATSAGALANFPVLPGIDCLTLFADADAPGMQAATACSERWNAAGREVRIVAPAGAIG